MSKEIIEGIESEVKFDEERNELIFPAKLKLAYSKWNDRKEISEFKVSLVNIPDEVYKHLDKVYSEVGKKYQPNWYKEQTGQMMLKSRFDFNVKDYNGRTIKLQQFIDNGLVSNAEVKMKIRLKESAIYPVAMIIVEKGELVDMFEGM